MGRWSDDIMGSDDALDTQSLIYDTAGVEQYPDVEVEEGLSDEEVVKQEEIVQQTVNAEMRAVLNDPEKLKAVQIAAENDNDDGLLILGVVMMSVGATISPEMKSELIDAVHSWAEDGQYEDDGYDEDEEDSDEEETDEEDDNYVNPRAEYRDEFLEAINNYKNEPTELTRIGLFEAIAIAATEGKEGLINK